MIENSTVMLMCVIAALIVILALLILFHHNLNATKGYTLRTLEHTRSELLLQEEVLNMQIAKAQSLDAIANDSLILSMQPVKKPQYAEKNTPPAKGVAMGDVGGIEYVE
jgi:uncharacterized membrane protein